MHGHDWNVSRRTQENIDVNWQESGECKTRRDILFILHLTGVHRKILSAFVETPMPRQRLNDGSYTPCRTWNTSDPEREWVNCDPPILPSQSYHTYVKRCLRPPVRLLHRLQTEKSNFFDNNLHRRTLARSNGSFARKIFSNLRKISSFDSERILRTGSFFRSRFLRTRIRRSSETWKYEMRISLFL